MNGIPLPEQPARKELSDTDLNALLEMLGNVTVTRSGMLRIMAFVVENPALRDTIQDGVFAVQNLEKNTQKIAKELEAIRLVLERQKRLVP